MAQQVLAREFQTLAFPVPTGWKERNRGERMLAVRGRLGFHLRTAGVARREGFRLVGR